MLGSSPSMTPNRAFVARIWLIAPPSLPAAQVERAVEISAETRVCTPLVVWPVARSLSITAWKRSTSPEQPEPVGMRKVLGVTPAPACSGGGAGGGGGRAAHAAQVPSPGRNAILALRELDPIVAIPLLRKGLQDSDEQVRIYAQNILSGLIERFEANLKELEQRVAAEPAAALHAIRLAEHFHELVYLDVAGDDETAAHYLATAQDILHRASALAPQDPQIPFLGLKCALRARD
eukprot:gene34026-45608_t